MVREGLPVFVFVLGSFILASLILGMRCMGCGKLDWAMARSMIARSFANSCSSTCSCPAS